ncbi:HAD-IIA family hydrolase [Arthrobacter echini]|uniref:HAD-IIA family hydrolase n=1 Tax=Arthrobacter echini TaxID=1529066 RepID=A0A4S5E0Q3_9MICC|nr:HAD-IIA family hydrolase [Arthrobacter echini]THJ64870.1 HAD-IIA family hydrolase [Arthrobacter echini]
MGDRLIDGFDGVLSDLDGVVYTGPGAILGATEALGKLEGAGKKLAYITNNASRSAEQVADHLRSLGAPATAEQVFGSARVGVELLAEHVAAGSRVLVVGSPALADIVRNHGFVVVGSAEESPDAVIQGFSPDLGWRDLAEASYAVAAGATWVATNTDMSIPQERGTAPGNGALVAAVRAATGAAPRVGGKPEAALFTTAARQLGLERALVVGDRLDTDILGGNRAQMATALVLTGVDSVRSALTAAVDERPTFLLGTIAGLFEEYPAVTPVDGSASHAFSCGEATAHVDGTAVSVRGDEDAVDSWRAACAAWWSAHPDETPESAPRISFR